MDDDVLDLSTEEEQDDDSTAGERSESEDITEDEAVAYQKKAIDQRLDALRYTRKRIREADDDQLVMQKLEGDVVVEVKPDEREEVADKIEATIEQLEEQKDWA